MIFTGIGVTGKEKRRFFNQQAGIAALAIGMAVGLWGLQTFGFWGGCSALGWAVIWAE
jgi:hypothetical protein